MRELSICVAGASKGRRGGGEGASGGSLGRPQDFVFSALARPQFLALVHFWVGYRVGFRAPRRRVWLSFHLNALIAYNTSDEDPAAFVFIAMLH
ncbi:hypothetical protein GWI33_015736 [Rhynchophorus ferrugineus]|uniref:Uncharacterized protein n=1 Tax=Rhynchophorus ferrugineus TaxID=354439 RepID=A0A834M7U0_RHYFE|nr:hypothetical protein GWI33_015736 [Rhynchophorus ferrugineus]